MKIDFQRRLMVFMSICTLISGNSRVISPSVKSIVPMRPELKEKVNRTRNVGFARIISKCRSNELSLLNKFKVT